MKKIFFIISIACFSCQKDHSPYNYSGKVTVEKNGIAWDVCIRLDEIPSKPGKYSIVLDAYDEHGYISEGLYFRNFNLEETTSLLLSYNGLADTSVSSSYSTSIGGDAGSTYYRLIEDYENIFTIAEVKNKCISGTFQCAFERDGTGNPADPDTVYFNNGVFEAKILK